MAKKVYKIVVTGPESTGKTVLAERLSGALNCPWAQEYARYYLSALPRPYRRNDLTAIGRGQMLWENFYTERATTHVVMDTDWTVLEVWEQFKYGNDGQWFWQKGYGEKRPADLYVLCAPDFPWSFDPLREHPEARELLFARYEALLSAHRLPYMVANGSLENRIQAAMFMIKPLLY